MSTINAVQKARRGLASVWAGNNPVLAAGELGYATDTGVLKCGDGTTAWNDLDGLQTGELSPNTSGITVSAIVADADLSGGSFTTLDTVNGDGSTAYAGIARASFVGLDVAVYDGTDGGKVFTVTTSGACTLVRQMMAGELVSAPGGTGGTIIVGANPTVDATSAAESFVWANDPIAALLGATDLTSLSDNYAFVTEVSNLRNHMYVGGAHDGGGVTDYIDQSRTGDDPGYYMADDNAALLTTGEDFPGDAPYTTTTAAMIALRNQAAGTGEGITGFYHARRMPTALTFTITTPLGSVTVTPANYASPQPVAGDVCLINGMTVDGQWQDSNIQEGEDLAVGSLTWRTTGSGMFTDFEDITATAGSGDLLSTNNLSDVASAATARTNLGLGDSATKNTGTSAGTVAEGDHTHTGVYEAVGVAAALVDDLSGVSNAATARTNLGLAIGTDIDSLAWAPRTVYKAANETITSDNTLSNDDTLQLTVGANEVWLLDVGIIFTSNNTADIQFTVTGPTGATGQVAVLGPAIGSTGLPAGRQLIGMVTTLGTAHGVGGVGASVVATAQLYGPVFISSTAGTVNIQWAQNTSDASNTVVLKGSTLTARRLA